MMEVDVNNQPTIVDVQTPDRSLNLHQNQTSEAQSESPPVETTVEGNITSSRDTSPKLSSDTKETGEGDAIIATRKTSLQTSAERVIAYEKMISQRDKEILILRTNANLLREKVTLLENSSQARTDNTNSMHMREVELEFMHQENDRVRQGAINENARLSTEVDTLKKDITVLQERMASERGDMETQLVCEKSRNIALSEKLADAALVSERTMLAYDTQRDLLNAKQEIIDNLRKESEITTQSRVPVLVRQAVRETGTMTSNTEPALEENDMVPRSKLVDLTKHYDGKIKMMNDDMELVKTELKDANDKLVAHDNQAATYKNGVKECCEFVEVHATNGAITNGFLLWADIQRKKHAEDIWKVQAEKRFLKEEITEAKEVLWRTMGEEVLGKIVRRKGNLKCSTELSDISAAMKTLSEKDLVPLFLCTSTMIARTPVYELDPENECNTENMNNIDNALNKIINLLKSDDRSPPVESERSVVSDATVPKTTLGDTMNVADTGTVQEQPENEWKKIRRNNQQRKTGGRRLNHTELVVSGVTLGTRGMQIAHYFVNEIDVDIRDWDLLTTRDDATFLSFKITVKNEDVGKLEDFDGWPEGWHVRPYKEPVRKNIRNNNKNMTRGKVNAAQSITEPRRLSGEHKTLPWNLIPGNMPEIIHPLNGSMETSYPGNTYSGNAFMRSYRNGTDSQNLPIGIADPGTRPVGAPITMMQRGDVYSGNAFMRNTRHDGLNTQPLGAMNVSNLHAQTTFGNNYGERIQPLTGNRLWTPDMLQNASNERFVDRINANTFTQQ